MASNYVERLRRLSVNQGGIAEDGVPNRVAPGTLDSKTMACARLAALIAVDATEPSFGEQVDAAIGAGASAEEIVEVLIGVSSIVGVPRVVAAAPKLAFALGYDLEGLDGW